MTLEPSTHQPLTAKAATLVNELYTIERGFWEEGGDFFRDHLDDKCLLAFPGMVGTQSREEVAASASDNNRWRDVVIEHRALVEPGAGSAIISYEASATRLDGTFYHAIASSGYVRRRKGGWKLMFHGQTPLAELRA